MNPKVIVHNSISLDGALVGFDVDMQLHYEIVGSYQPDILLIGSNTITKGIELFMDENLNEQPSDMEKLSVDPNDKRPIWVIIDTKGKLHHLMHILRQSEFCKELIIGISSSTPQAYVDYLTKRSVEYILTGEKYADYQQLLQILADKYNVKTVVVDSGPTLSSILFNQKLVDELSLVIHPVVTTEKDVKMFSTISQHLRLEMMDHKVSDKGLCHVLYRLSDNI